MNGMATATHCRLCGCTAANRCLDANGAPCAIAPGAIICSRCWHGGAPDWIPRTAEDWEKAVEKAAAYFGELRFQGLDLDAALDHTLRWIDADRGSIHDEILERGEALGYRPRPTSFSGGGPLP